MLVFCTRREECERLAALIQREFAELPEKSRQKTGKGGKKSRPGAKFGGNSEEFREKIGKVLKNLGKF